MTTWVTSDWHLGHKRISELAGRPFDSVESMNRTLINNHNERVMPGDTVFVLGDVVMGSFEENIQLVKRFNGDLILIPGNHDRIFSLESDGRISRFMPMYEEVFDVVATEQERLSLDEAEDDRIEVLLSHFPYDGDSHEEDRFSDFRPVDRGAVLLHGHTHSKEKISRSKAGTLQIHVGVDANSYYPLSETEILQIIKDNT